VDLLPPLKGGDLSAVEFAHPGGGGPAAAVNGDFLPGGLSEVVPDMPPVADLKGIGQGLMHRIGVAGGAVTADDLDARMLTQPRGKSVGPAVGQDIDPPAGLGVDQNGREVRDRRSEKSSTPSTRGVATAGSGIPSRARSAACRESCTPSAKNTRALARPANSRTIAPTCANRRTVRL
jgi:hypothetical protein